MKKLLSKLKIGVKAGLIALVFVFKDPRTPLRAKIVAGLAALYLAMPFDLVPVALVDDAIIVPLMLFYSYKVMPKEVLADAREKVRSFNVNLKRVIIGLVALVIIFVIIAFSALYFLIRSIF